jgi:ketosteroid isomerase-like protein
VGTGHAAQAAGVVPEGHSAEAQIRGLRLPQGSTDEDQHRTGSAILRQMHGNDLDVVRRWLAAFNRRDVSGFVELWNPRCEYFTLTGSQLAGAPYEGHDGLRRYCEEREETWEELRIDSDDLREIDDRIVLIGRMAGRGLGSGVSIEHEMALVFELHDGLVLRVRSYWDPTEALAEAAPGPG